MKHYYMKKVMCLSYGVIRCMHFVVAFRIFITEIVVVNTMVEPKKAKVPVTIRIDPEMLILLKQEAEKRGETVSNYIRSSAVMRINGELVPASKDDTRNAYLRSRGIR